MKNNFLKIIYFDEPFVADFMQIIAGGQLKKTTEFITEVESSVGANGQVDAGVGTGGEKKGLPKIFEFLSGASLNVSIGADGSISRKSDKVAKNILENTLLADFIELLEADERRSKNKRCDGIKIFQNVSVRPELNSFTFFMLMAPFLNMIDGEMPISMDDGQLLKIDITKVASAIEDGRGYYEFISEIDGKEIVLRFNHSAFRNGYTMSDLPKMQLTYYAIKVGSIDKQDLQVQKEFAFGTDKISKRADYSGDAVISQNLDVYDVVLAGIVE